MNTRTHILSSTTLTAGVSGDILFETGATNLVVSFSGVNDSGTYLKFLVQYSNDPNLYTIQNTSKTTDVKDQTISKTFLPTSEYVTTYSVDVSGLKNDLSIDRYRITLNVGKTVASTYKDLKIVNSHAYTNNEGSNYLLLSLEAQNPRYFGSVIVPFVKDLSVYEPGPPTIFRPSDDHILRTEIFSFNGSHMPIITDPNGFRRAGDEIIAEDQVVYMIIGSEGNDGTYFKAGHGIQSERDGTYGVRSYPAKDINDASIESTLEMIIIPEDGIDYAAFDHPDLVSDQENFGTSGVVNIFIDKIYPDGIAS